MKDLTSLIGGLQPDQVWRWSQPVLFMALAVGLAAVLLAAWLSTTALLVLSAFFLGGLLVGIAIRDEVALLSAVLAGFILAAQYEEGFQIEEAIYGVIYLTYLGYWFVSRLFFYHDNILRSRVDWALFLFLIYVTLSLGLTPILDGDMTIAVSEWLSVTMLAFYFPIKEACIRHQKWIPHRPILLSLGLVALFIALRNFWLYKRGLQEAEFLWQIASGRVVMNEHILLMAGIITLSFLLYSRKWLHSTGLTLLFAIFSAGVLIGQSRAVWVSYALGIFVVFLCVDRKKKMRLMFIATAGLGSVVAIGAVMFDNFFTVIIAGLIDRVFSLQSAVVEDVSLVNRFIEMGVAWEYIKENPIVGYGFGVPLKYYSLVYEATRVSSFVHNGYIGVWYRHGLIGFVLLFTFYFGTMRMAYHTVRAGSRRMVDRIVVVAALACLVAEALAGNTQNPFATSDIALMVASVAALAAASHHNNSST